MRAELRRFVDRRFEDRRRFNSRKRDFRIVSTLDFHAIQRERFGFGDFQMIRVGPCATLASDYLCKMHRIRIELVNRRFDQSSVFANSYE